MSNDIDRKEIEAKSLIEMLRRAPDKIIEIATLSYALGLETGMSLAAEKDPAA